MSHPTTRAERRHQRERVITARRFVYLHIWTHLDYEFMQDVTNPLINIEYVFEKYRLMKVPFSRMNEYPEWGRYAKWNLNCSCKRCRGKNGWERFPAKRRRELKTKDSDWELQYSEDQDVAQLLGP